MIITGGIQVAKESTLRNRYLSEAYRREAIPGFAARAEAVKSGGAVAVAQLCHLGRETLGANTVYPFVAPSDVLSPREPAPARVLSTDEVGEVVRAFAVSARNCVEAGFDAVELHGAHGYLLAQFLSKTVNTRNDRYGGSARNRCTLIVEIIEAIRRELPDTPVGLRVSVENDPGGTSLEDFGELLPLIQDRAPFDYLNLTFGVRGYYVRDMATARPPLLDHSAELRSAVGVPLLLCSMFRDPGDIERALTEGAADLVGMARPHIADPDIVNKLIQGRADEVRPCVSCNEDCRSFDPTALCTVNPDLAPRGMSLRPGEPRTLAAPRNGGRTLAVVGAGPAGLECALTAAKSGTVEVTVFDENERIGGALAVASAAPQRSGWTRLLRFYERQLHRLGVTVRLGSRVGPQDLGGYDHVVWAVGAEEEPVTVSGEVPTLRSSDFLADQSRARRWSRLVVLDDGFGWWPTVSAVEAARAQGVERISVVTPGPGFAGGIPAESRMQLTERLRGLALDVLPLTTVIGSGPGVVKVRNLLSDEEREIGADALITVGTRRSRTVPDEHRGSAWAIGDCVSPRRVSAAITEGRHAGLAVLESSAVSV